MTARLALLVGAMRAGGVRLGVGDLRAARRALAAVDRSSHADSYLALRGSLCSRQSEVEVFDAAFEATFGEAACPRADEDVLASHERPPRTRPAGRRGAHAPGTRSDLRRRRGGPC